MPPTTTQRQLPKRRIPCTCRYSGQNSTFALANESPSESKHPRLIQVSRGSNPGPNQIWLTKPQIKTTFCSPSTNIQPPITRSQSTPALRFYPGALHLIPPLLFHAPLCKREPQSCPRQLTGAISHQVPSFRCTSSSLSHVGYVRHSGISSWANRRPLTLSRQREAPAMLVPTRRRPLLPRPTSLRLGPSSSQHYQSPISFPRNSQLVPKKWFSSATSGPSRSAVLTSHSSGIYRWLPPLVVPRGGRQSE